jgi:hypothetical protein
LIEQCLDESVGCHVRPLPRPEHGEVPQRDGGEPTLLRVRPHQDLRGELARAVGTQRTRHCGFDQRPVLRTVDRGAGGVDEPAHARCGGGLQQALRRDDVALDVGPEGGPPRGRHTGLAGEVHDGVDPLQKGAQIVPGEVPGDHVDLG